MKPFVLAILDGWGYSNKRGGNPIQEARKPNLDAIATHYPLLLLQASGLAVGLEWGDFGNSEVGHLTIGAGRIVQQYSTRINKAIKDGSLFTHPVMLEVFKHPRVHLIGLLTSGTVHASYEHLAALLNFAEQRGVQPMLHLFTDGKDSGLREGELLLKKLPVPPTTLIGRDFAMDRDQNWQRTQQAVDLIIKGTGIKTENFFASLEQSYLRGTTDTKIPALVTPSYDGIKEQDAVFFFNFREDSIRQLYQKCTPLPEVFFATMTKYLETDETFVIDPPDVVHNLAETLSIAKKRQLHIAETTKYAHVTYFFNGLKDKPYEGEDDVLFPSVRDVEAEPAMQAREIADRVVKAMDDAAYDFILINFANADMLAHTGNYEATRQGIEAVDAAVGQILESLLKNDGIMMITADHGNAEELVDKITNAPESRHGGNPVPLYLVGKKFETTHYPLPTEPAGILADIAPTILELMGIPKPAEMTGVSLLPTLLGPGTAPQTDRDSQK